MMKRERRLEERKIGMYTTKKNRRYRECKDGEKEMESGIIRRMEKERQEKMKRRKKDGNK